jgi:hypothetical protein
MRLNRAPNCVETRQRPVQSAPFVPKEIVLDRDIVERGAKALFEYVFSSCDRFDGKHHWESCDEDTKDGFRGEVSAVIKAVWPALSCRETRPPSMPAEVGLGRSNMQLFLLGRLVWR